MKRIAYFSSSIFFYPLLFPNSSSLTNLFYESPSHQFSLRLSLSLSTSIFIDFIRKIIFSKAKKLTAVGDGGKKLCIPEVPRKEDVDVLKLRTRCGNDIMAVHVKHPKASATMLYSDRNPADLGQIYEFFCGINPSYSC